MDRVHDAMDRWRTGVHGGLRAVRTLGMAVPHRHATRQVLWGPGAHQRRPEMNRVMRRSW
jgi:hypothetical protein